MAVTATVMVMAMATEVRNRQSPSWYPLRVTYSREMKVKGILQDSGFECFVPMTVKCEVKCGKKTVKTVPAVNNLCFVKSCRAELDMILREKGLREFVSYLWDKSTREPLTVPDKAMEDFITVSEARLEDIVYLFEVNSKLRTGMKVRVKSGPFAGVEGVVIRVKRSRRVMVELPGMLAIATSYIPEDELELV